MTLTKNEHGYWECRLKGPDNKIKSFSTHKKNRKEAVEVIKAARIPQLELAAEIGALTPNVVSVIVSGTRMTVEAAIEPWKDWMRYDRQSKNSIAASESWVRAWAYQQCKLDQSMMGIVHQDIDPWLNDPRLETKASTRRAMLAAIRSFFKYACARGWTMGNPASLCKIDYSLLQHSQKEVVRKPIFEDAEVDKLLEITAPGADRESEFWHAAVAIARWTGLRLVDICCLEWDCLETPGKLICWTRKRDKRVCLDLAPVALQDAFQAMDKTDDTYLFPIQRAIVLDPKQRSGLSVQFMRLCKHAGIFGKSFHSLRATLATRLSESGVNRDKIREILGHSSTEITEGYIRPGQPD